VWWACRGCAGTPACKRARRVQAGAGDPRTEMPRAHPDVPPHQLAVVLKGLQVAAQAGGVGVQAVGVGVQGRVRASEHALASVRPFMCMHSALTSHPRGACPRLIQGVVRGWRCVKQRRRGWR